VAPEAYTEHPNWAPDFGAWYVSQVVDILADNPDVWSKTVLFVTYDEEGGFFDHKVPPTPAASLELGGSTVDTVNELYPGSPGFVAGPYGLGLRVPMIVASPWTRGGWVNSQLFDHTSLIRFLEARFAGANRDLIESNITPWRRAVAGDLTSAFDFRDPNTKRPRLPDTSAFAPPNTDRYPDFDVVAPTDPAMPAKSPASSRRGRCRTCCRPTRPWPATAPCGSTSATAAARPRCSRCGRPTRPTRHAPTPSSPASASTAHGRQRARTTTSACTARTGSCAGSAVGAGAIALASMWSPRITATTSA
jgi:hypothetical protein